MFLYDRLGEDIEDLNHSAIKISIINNYQRVRSSAW